MSLPQSEPQLARTPPERRPVPGVVLASPGCGCCCSCCCCCLHSVGSLIGGIIASRQTTPEEESTRLLREPDGLDNSVGRLYWWVVMVILVLGGLISLTFVALFTYSGYGPGYSVESRISEAVNAAGITVLVMAIGCLPAVQLVASLVCLCIILLVYREPGPSLRRLGWVTLYTFAGTVAGIVVMVVLALGFAGHF